MDPTVTLKCHNCGGNLDISPDMEHFACGYCGSKQIVLRRGGTISLKTVSEAIARVQIGTDKTAAELAVKRLRQELFELDESWNRYMNDYHNNKNQLTEIVATIFALGVISVPLLYILYSTDTIGIAVKIILFIVLLAILICVGINLIKGAIKVRRDAQALHISATSDFNYRRNRVVRDLEDNLSLLRNGRSDH